jgi:hypothetical protein
MPISPEAAEDIPAESHIQARRSPAAHVDTPGLQAAAQGLRAFGNQKAAFIAGSGDASWTASGGQWTVSAEGSGAARNAAAAFVGATAASKASSVTRCALDQSSRYADLGLSEEQLIKNGQHVLVAYIMKPKAGYDYLATAAHFAAESSTGTNVNVCTTDDFTKSVDALVYYIDPENEEMKTAYPVLLFDRNITDGRAMMCSILTLTIGNNQGMGDVEYGKIYDIYFRPNTCACSMAPPLALRTCGASWAAA